MKKVNKETLGEKTFHLEDENGIVVDSNRWNLDLYIHFKKIIFTPIYLFRMKSVEKFKNFSYCLGGTQNSPMINNKTAKTFNTKTDEENIILRGDFSVCKRNETKLVSDKTRGAEGPGVFFIVLGKGAAKFSKYRALKLAKNHSTAAELAADSSTAAETRNLKRLAANTPFVEKKYSDGRSILRWKNSKHKVIVF